MYPSSTFKTILSITTLSLTLSCTKDRDNDNIVPPKLETKTYKNLYAPQTGGAGQPTAGAFTKFSFSANNIVTDNNWDIAFRGTTIIVNGGTTIGITDEPTRTGSGAVSILSSTLDAVKTIPGASTFKQDGANTYAIPTGSGNGWYNYNSTTNLITPVAGKIFVIKTHDGKYAKLEIISYYKDAPTKPDPATGSRYYTFTYVYQPTGTTF